MITVEKLESLNSKDLQKEATKLGVKGSKSYTKSDLLALCITLITPTEAGDNEDLGDEITEEEIELSKEDRTISVDEEVFYEDELLEEESESNEEEIYIESINGEKKLLSEYPSSLDFNEKKFYQLYPVTVKRDFCFKVIREFLTPKKSKITVLDPQGNIVLVGTDCNLMYLKTIKFIKETEIPEYKGAKITIYHESIIKSPNYIGKTY